MTQRGSDCTSGLCGRGSGAEGEEEGVSVCECVCVCVCDRELCFHALQSSERISVTEKQAKRQSVKKKVR